MKISAKDPESLLIHGILFFVSFEFSKVANCSERSPVIVAITGIRATEVSSLASSVTCPPDAAAALAGTGKESRRTRFWQLNSSREREIVFILATFG